MDQADAYASGVAAETDPCILKLLGVPASDYHA
jgi:hypothetical protein